MHVLSAPPAFILSQDQTLILNMISLLAHYFSKLLKFKKHIVSLFRTIFQSLGWTLFALFNFQGTVSHLSATFYILHHRFWFVKNFFNFFWSFFEVLVEAFLLSQRRVLYYIIAFVLSRTFLTFLKFFRSSCRSISALATTSFILHHRINFVNIFFNFFQSFYWLVFLTFATTLIILHSFSFKVNTFLKVF